MKQKEVKVRKKERKTGKFLTSESSLISLKLETVTFHLSSHPWSRLVLDYDANSVSLYISWKDGIEDVDGETIFHLQANGKTEKVSIGVKELSDSLWFIDADPANIFKLLSEFSMQVAWERDSKIKKAIQLLLSTLTKAGNLATGKGKEKKKENDTPKGTQRNKFQCYYLDSFSYILNGEWKKFEPAEFCLSQNTDKVLIKSPNKGCIIKKAVLLSFVREEESKDKRKKRRNTKKNLHVLKEILTKKFPGID